MKSSVNARMASSTPHALANTHAPAKSRTGRSKNSTPNVIAPRSIGREQASLTQEAYIPCAAWAKRDGPALDARVRRAKATRREPQLRAFVRREGPEDARRMGAPRQDRVLR